jgi:hypothetical protein
MTILYRHMREGNKLTHVTKTQSKSENDVWLKYLRRSNSNGNVESIWRPERTANPQSFVLYYSALAFYCDHSIILSKASEDLYISKNAEFVCFYLPWAFCNISVKLFHLLETPFLCNTSQCFISTFSVP